MLRIKTFLQGLMYISSGSDLVLELKQFSSGNDVHFIRVCTVCMNKNNLQGLSICSDCWDKNNLQEPMCISIGSGLFVMIKQSSSGTDLHFIRV